MMRWPIWVLVGIALLAVFAFWLWVGSRDPRVAVTSYEVVPAEEAATILRLVRAATQVVTDEAGRDNLFKRDAHAKPHGCVHGTFTVFHGIDTRLSHGVFSRPGRQYPAWIRFSNGTQADDRKPDARGMAIKLMGVEGEKLLPRERHERTQDFVMINYSTFFVRNVAEYETFFRYQSEHQPIRYFFGDNPFNPFNWRLHEFRHASRTLFQKVADPLEASYYSMTAYKLGPRNVKYAALPCGDRPVKMPKEPTPYHLRQAMVQHLNERRACFYFAFQLQDSNENMPIEDPSIEWQEHLSPFVPVARLNIPVQAFSSDAQNAFCENLSFTPWHALPEHRPIGGLNRSRKAVYEATSIRRHYRNGFVRREPDASSIPFTPAGRRALPTTSTGLAQPQ